MSEPGRPLNLRPEAPPETGRRGAAGSVLREEVLIVLSLSLLASAVFAIIDLLSAPISGVSVSLYSNAGPARQVASIVFGLAPVALVLHLARRTGESAHAFGLGTERIRSDAGWGVLLGLAVAVVGLGVYLGSVALRVNRFVVPVPPLGHWWTVPVLILGAAQAALLEEVVSVGYLVHRLGQVGWSASASLAASATLRGTYHLYQGWGGFAGNVALGLAFAYIFLKWRRTWPLVIAHFLVDALAGIGFILFGSRLPGVV